MTFEASAIMATSFGALIFAFAKKVYNAFKMENKNE